MDEKPSFLSAYIARQKAYWTSPKGWLILAAALALGYGGAHVGRKIYLEPIREVAVRRFEAHQSLMRLYGLQKAHIAARGSYASDLEALLALSPEAAALREKLRANVDMNTLVVAGDRARFRLEANVLDPQRTLIKIRGPYVRR